LLSLNQGTNEWEVGLGTLDATSANLTRTTVLTSSNSDAAVNFTSGTKDVFCTLPASKAVYLDSTGAPVGAASNGFAVAMLWQSHYNKKENIWHKIS
jgi:hypothetical protein